MVIAGSEVVPGQQLRVIQQMNMTIKLENVTGINMVARHKRAGKSGLGLLVSGLSECRVYRTAELISASLWLFLPTTIACASLLFRHVR